MKKRILSLLLVLMMLISLLPAGALAEVGDAITITKQPVADIYANPGDRITLSLQAKATEGTLKYLWMDLEDIDFSGLDGFQSFLDIIGAANYGTSSSVSLTVTDAMDGKTIACVVYSVKTVIGFVTYPVGYEVSDGVTIHLYPDECESHSVLTNLTKVDAVPSTCAEEGNREYYICDVCQHCYLDENGQTPIALDAVKLPKSNVHEKIVHYMAYEGSCHENGNIEYYGCSLCGQPFSDAQGTKMISWDSVSTGLNNKNHTGLTEIPEVPGTCEAEGNIHYWYCTDCNTYWSNESLTRVIEERDTRVDRDKTNHLNLIEYPAKSPTCKEEGNIRYYYCEDCHDYFTDPLGHNKVSHADTELDKLKHNYAWFAMEADGVEWHENRCTMCGTIKETGQHTGGTATCTSAAKCEVCGQAYGYIDPGYHPNLEREILVPATKTQPGLCDVYCPDCGYQAMNVTYNLRDDCKHDIQRIDLRSPKCEDCEGDDAYGMRAHYECTKCGMIFKDKEGTTEITDIDSLKIEPLKHYLEVNDNHEANFALYALHYGYDSFGHWETCKYCDYDFGKVVGYGVHNMRNSTADCSHGTKTCIVCGYTTEDKNPDKHTGATEVVGAYEPEGDMPGYTGDTICTSCGEIIEKGHIYYAVCGECAKHLNYHEGKDATCTGYGSAEYWQCTKCLHYYADAKATVELEDTVIAPLGHDFHPGLDALTSIDVIDIIQNMFPDMDWGQIIKEFFDGDFSAVTDIELEDFINSVHMRDMDHCSDDTHHWLGCQRCGLSFRDLKAEFEKNGIVIDDQWYTIGDKAEHSGGLADCQTKAVCDECGDVYGDFGDHRFNTRTVGNSCTEPTKIEHYCTVCDFVDESLTEEGPVKGHVFDGGKCSVCGQILQNPFYDVKSGDRFFTPVMWAYYFQPQIIAGATATTFNPQGSCTRAQVVTFLWRHAGRPAPTITVSPFYDVQNPNAYYYDAVLWAYENNIVAGITANTFEPNTTVNRAQFVTFLWRYLGRPEPVNNFNPFMDVSDTSPYRTAIVWAVGAGVTSGYDASHFRPSQTCSRWQVATFMYNAIHGK